jgi:hypothetical protein
MESGNSALRNNTLSLDKTEIVNYLDPDRKIALVFFSSRDVQAIN